MKGKYLICKGADNASIFESEEMEKAWAILFADKEKTFSVVQISPAVRVSIGERFGMHSGEDSIGKIATALCAMGADAVVDASIGGDVVAISDAKTVRSRKDKGEKTPLFSSKCAAVADYIRAKYPDIEASGMASEDSVSAILLKEYYKEQTGKTVRVISVEPCKAKKFLYGVDAVITSDELEDMLVEVEEVGVSVRTLKKRALDMPLGVPSGSAYITEFSGGMAEAVARSLNKNNDVAFVEKLGYSGFYGLKPRREAIVEVDGKTFRFAVVCGMDEVDALVKETREGNCPYDYIEITACEGGCICSTELPAFNEEGLRLRRAGLQAMDKKRSSRIASANLIAQEMKKHYDAWLRKKKAGEIEEEPDVEPVVIDDDFSVNAASTQPSAQEQIEVKAEEKELELVPAPVESEIAVSETVAAEDWDEEAKAEALGDGATASRGRISKKDRRKMKRANKRK